MCFLHEIKVTYEHFNFEVIPLEIFDIVQEIAAPLT
jgi:hypothetical protein